MILDENTMAMITPNSAPCQLYYCMRRYDKLAIDGDNLAKDDPCIVYVSCRPCSTAAALPRCDTTYEIKFLVLILGARTPPPKMDAPVTKIPLRPHISPFILSLSFHRSNSPCCAGHAETDAEADTDQCPCIRRGLCEKVADVECLSLPLRCAVSARV